MQAAHRIVVPRIPSWLPPGLGGKPFEVRFRFSAPERNVYRKRPRVPVSDWAERHRVVTRGPFEGSRFRKNTALHLSEVMDAAMFPGVQTAILCASLQSGKSFVVDTCVGYGVDRAPGPVLYVYPNEITGNENMSDRIIPMVRKSARLRSYLTGSPNDVGNQRINFQHMQIYVGWAGSATSLSNKSIKVLVLDELDKYPVTAGSREASPEALAEGRTTVYRHAGRKIFKISTPTVETGPIWVALIHEASVIFDRFALCPDCGALQLMTFGRVRWPETERDPEKILAQNLAWYECAACGSHWGDHKRDAAVRFGEWRARPLTEDGLQREEPSETPGEELFAYLRKYKPLKIGFHLPSWISRWVGISEVAAAFLKGTKDKNSLKDWKNKHEAVPWRAYTVERKEDGILKLRDHRPSGIVPSGGVVACLVAGVDTQDRSFFYRIRAFGWGMEEESWGIRCGELDSWEALRKVLFDDYYADSDGRQYAVKLIVQDAMGHRTSEVYDFVRPKQGRILAAQGVDTRKMATPISWTNVEFYPGTKKLIPGGIRLLRHDANFWKNKLAGKLAVNATDPGAFHCEAEATEEYARHMCAEAIDEKSGLWTCPTGRANHYWDCEVLCLVAAAVLGVRFSKKAESREPRAESKARRVISAGVGL